MQHLRTFICAAALLCVAQLRSVRADGRNRQYRRCCDRLVRRRAAGRVRHGAEHGHQHRPRDDDRRTGPLPCARASARALRSVRPRSRGFSVAPGDDVQVQVGQTIPVDLQAAAGRRDGNSQRHRPTPRWSTSTRTDVSQSSARLHPRTSRSTAAAGTTSCCSAPASPTTATSAWSATAASPVSTTTTWSTASTTTRRSSRRRAAARARCTRSAPPSIKEFQVGVSNMSAEFGRAAGGTVNAVTKSGTNTVQRRGLLLPARQGVPGPGSVHRRTASGMPSTNAASSSARRRWADQP